MRKQDRRLAERQRNLQNSKPRTEQEVRDTVPLGWKARAEAAKHQISVRIPGTNHYT